MTKRQGVTIAVLSVLVLTSAMVAINTKHENRNLMYELDQLRAEKARLETEWAQLQLEEATLAHHGRVEQLARDKLDMIEPDRAVTVPSAATQ